MGKICKGVKERAKTNSLDITEVQLTLHSDSGLCGGGSSVVDSAAHVSARIVVVSAVDLQDAQVVFSPHLVVLV